MIWIITEDIVLYYDGVCAWLLYGSIGSPSRSETLVPLEKGTNEYGPHRCWADTDRLVTWEHTKW